MAEWMHNTNMTVQNHLQYFLQYKPSQPSHKCSTERQTQVSSRRIMGAFWRRAGVGDPNDRISSAFASIFEAVKEQRFRFHDSDH